VLRLFADGLTNAETTARMYLGAATVKSHLSRILMKLGLKPACRARCTHIEPDSSAIRCRSDGVGSDHRANRRRCQGDTMKYMLMMFGDATTMMEERSTDWVRDMVDFMTAFNEEITTTGELVSAEGLDFPHKAKTIALVDGQVTVTDGPFAEAKESLAGFWIWDVEDEARAIELAGRIVQWADRVELRPVGEKPQV
jgi:hypothetical protein